MIDETMITIKEVYWSLICIC